MNNAKRYEAAVSIFLSRRTVPHSQHAALLDGAERVDNLIFTIADDCRRLAENLTRHATQDRKSTRLNSSHVSESRMPSSA